MTELLWVLMVCSLPFLAVLFVIEEREIERSRLMRRFPRAPSPAPRTPPACCDG